MCGRSAWLESGYIRAIFILLFLTLVEGQAHASVHEFVASKLRRPAFARNPPAGVQLHLGLDWGGREGGWVAVAVAAASHCGGPGSGSDSGNGLRGRPFWRGWMRATGWDHCWRVEAGRYPQGMAELLHEKALTSLRKIEFQCRAGFEVWGDPGAGTWGGMDLSSIRDAFERVSKKQKLSNTKTHDVLDRMIQEIEHTAKQLLETVENQETDCRPYLVDLQARLTEMGPANQLAASQKEVNLAVSKYGKVLDKVFNLDISKAYREIDFDSNVINKIVALHFYRQGLFDLGDCFVQETQQQDALALKAPFYEMYQILEQMKNRNLEAALGWARAHTEDLHKKGSSLEFKLHQLQFVHVLHTSGRAAALKYGRSCFELFASQHMLDIQRLMGCLLFAGRLESSPYSDLLAAAHWDAVALEFTRECCSLLGQAYESPLHVVITAGSQALPTLLKLASVMAKKKHEWLAMKQLPVEIELDKEFQFHSIFACPVSREQSTAENPPMLMPCGHVLCKQSIQKLAKGNSRTFKCPYCPLETTQVQCRQIYF